MARVNPATGRKIRPLREKAGKITTAGRLSLPPSKFALPPGAEEKRRGIKGRYPIDTKERARNALARVARFGSPSEKSRVRAMVARLYPEIEISKGLKRGGRK